MVSCNSLVMSRGDTGVEILVFQWEYWISIYQHQFCCSLRVRQHFRGKPKHDFLIAFPLGGPGGLLACSHLQPLTAQPRGSRGTRNASNLASRPPCFWDCPSVPKMPAMGKSLEDRLAQSCWLYSRAGQVWFPNWSLESSSKTSFSIQNEE